MHTELKALRYFVMLSDTLSFTVAAARLGVTQPALSFAIQRLEEQLGAKLLNRTSRSVGLTAAGKAYLDGARDLLTQISQLEKTVTEVANGKDGLCRYGFVQSASFDVVPQVMLSLRRQAPGIRYQLTELTSSEQLRMLADGEIDVGMVRQAYYAPEVLQLTRVHSQRMVAALSALKNEPFVMGPDRRVPALNARIRNACAQAGFEPHSPLEVVEMATILAFVGDGLGVALLPAGCRRFADKNVALVDLADETEYLDLPLYLAHRKNERDPAVLRTVAIVIVATSAVWPLSGDGQGAHQP
jgi:DNA-binding transcriptional LysR family regulator